MAAVVRLGAAADLCVRRDARPDPGTTVPRRPDDRGIRPQCSLFRTCGSGLPRPFAQCTPHRFPAAERRMTVNEPLTVLIPSTNPPLNGSKGMACRLTT